MFLYFPLTLYFIKINISEMPGSGQKHYGCFNCPNRVRQKDRHIISSRNRAFIAKLTGRTPSNSDFLCNKCRCMCQHHIKRKTSMPSRVQQVPAQSTEAPPFSPPSIPLPFPSTSRGHASCCMCKRQGPKLVVVPVGARHHIFITKEVIIPAGARCCPNHLQQNIDDLNPLSDSTLFNKTGITELVKFLRNEVLKKERTRLDFDSGGNLASTDYQSLLGIPKTAFEDLLKYVEGKVKVTPVRTVRTTLAIFLMKLRGGESNRILSTLFNISKSSVHRGVKSIRTVLMNGGFVAENLGFGHVTREQIIQEHTRPLAQMILGDTVSQPAILVLDGTYIYIHKSGNFKFQRQSFSLHKGRPLVKPMIIVSTTGYFVSVLGPYIARNNDATILNHIMHSNLEDIRSWVQEEDIFVVDRGFRDSLDCLEQMGINAKMPSFLNKGDKQMSTENANTSRLVTKVWNIISISISFNIRYICKIN